MDPSVGSSPSSSVLLSLLPLLKIKAASKAYVKCQQLFQKISLQYQFFSPLKNLEINNIATGERLKNHLVSKS